MTLVLDTNVVLAACSAENGFSFCGQDELVAPPLMWPEARSTLHEAVWRGVLTHSQGLEALAQVERAPVSLRNPESLAQETWNVAEELGWAKTYDAEYIALARILGCRLVTLDARLRRGASRLGFVVTPAEL